jgi:hypothetical protein
LIFSFYNHTGELVRHTPATLYTWHFLVDVQYLYTPFAALGFAAGSLLPWPVRVTGPRAFLPYGLVGFGSGPHSLTEIFRLHGLQLVSWNLFVLAGLVMFAVLMAWAARAWRASYLSRSPISSAR